MHWTSIMTALALSSTTAYLVIAKSWEIWEASLLVCGVMSTLILAALTTILLFVPREERKQYLINFSKGLVNEFKNAIKYLHLK